MGIQTPFPVDPALTGISLAYRNKRLIADDVLPRLDPPLMKKEFVYHKMTTEERYTIPDTKVGRRGAPNEVGFTSSRLTDEVEDFGLDDPIPFDDVNNSPEGFSPLDNSTESLTDLIMLDREKRVADLVFAATTYPTANKKTISGTDQWNDTANSDPIKEISDALDAVLVRPNVMVIGRTAFTTLARHPAVNKAVNGTAGDAGLVPRSALADIFGLEDILVGEAFINSAKKGQTASYARAWGKHCALIYRDRLSRGDQNRPTFGFTAQYGTRVAGQDPDKSIGLRGGIRVRVGESVKEVISCNDAAYFLQNVIA